MSKVGMCMSLSRSGFFSFSSQGRQVRLLLQMYPSSKVLLNKVGADAVLKKPNLLAVLNCQGSVTALEQ